MIWQSLGYNKWREKYWTSVKKFKLIKSHSNIGKTAITLINFELVVKGTFKINKFKSKK